MKVHYPKLYSMAHLLALNVLLLPKNLTIIFVHISKVLTQIVGIENLEDVIYMSI